MSGRSARRRVAYPSIRVWWALVIALFVGGLALWTLGIRWAAPLPGVAVLGFVVLAWLEVAPQGGHVHDAGLSAYGVAEVRHVESGPGEP